MARIGSEKAATGRPSPRISATVSIARLLDPPPRLADEIVHHAVDEPADRLVHEARLLESGMARSDFGEDGADERQIGEVLHAEELGAQTIVDVVIVVGDVVGERRNLRLGRGPGRQLEIVPRDIVGDGEGQRRPGERAVMLHRAFERLPGEVQSVEPGIAPFEASEDAQGLIVVREAAMLLHRRIERLLAGMAERRVAEIVRQRQRLGQILVEAERAGDAARDLRDLEAVRQARAVMVALVRDEDLRLVLQPAEGGRVDDAVAVALERRARRAFGLGMEPAAARFRGGMNKGPSPASWHGNLAPRAAPAQLCGGNLT